LETNKKAIKYIAIKEKILQMIQDGQYKSGDKLPSEQELASMHQVSVITSKKTLDELEKDGYIYRIKGSGSFVTDERQADKTNQLNIIAMVLPLGSNTGGGMELFYSVEMIAKSNGYYVSVENTHGSCQKEREIILSLLRDNIKGIIYYPTYTSENFDLIKKLATEKYPIVVIDKLIHDIEVDTVHCDNYSASFAMTKYLIQSGHRSIAFVCEGYIDERSSLRERFLGYCDALVESGIPMNIDLIFYPNSGYQLSLEKNEKTIFFKNVADKIINDRSVTAVQVASDADAVDFIRVCTKKGISIPDDITVVGFDDLDIASYITPALTTAKQNFKLIGQNAAELVFKRLADREKKAEKILIPADLVIRKSSSAVDNTVKRAR
jgi:GntR family transcriptional regulator, arabinose operon transcriptional repressor